MRSKTSSAAHLFVVGFMTSFLDEFRYLKNIAMRSCPGQRKDERRFVLVIDQNPIGFDVAISMPLVIAMKRMIFIFRRQFASFTKNVNDIQKFVHVIATLL